MKSHAPLTILMVTNNYTPYSGGVVRSIDVLTERLRQQGHTVHIVTLDFTGKHVDKPGVTRISCPVKFMYREKHIAIPWNPEQCIEDIVASLKPDIIHAHHPFLLGVSACTIAQRYAIPITFTYHTLYEKYTHYVPLPDSMLQPLTTRKVMSFCRSVDHIIVPNGSLQAYLTKHKVATSTSVVPSPIASVFFKPVKRIIDQNCTIKLLTVSRFAKEKNIEALLDMFAKLDSARYSLTLVGYGDYLSKLRKHAFEYLKLTPQSVTFVVQPSEFQLVRLYQESHLFIFASQTETQGLVLGEAMATGLPVVALRGPGQNDIVDSAVNGMLVDTLEDMKHALESIAIDNEWYQLLQRNACTTAQKYSSANLTQKLIELYQSLV